LKIIKQGLIDKVGPIENLKHAAIFLSGVNDFEKDKLASKINTEMNINTKQIGPFPAIITVHTGPNYVAVALMKK